LNRKITIEEKGYRGIFLVIGEIDRCPLCRVDMGLNHMFQGGSLMFTVGFPFNDGLAQ